MIVAQLIEEREKIGPCRQKFRAQFGQIKQRWIEQNELAIAVKDRKTRCQMREGFRERLHEIALSRFRVDDCMNVRSEIQVPITERLARYIKPMRAIVRDILERNALRVRFYACVARHFKQGAVCLIDAPL